MTDTAKPRAPESTPRPLDQPGSGTYANKQNLDQPGSGKTTAGLIKSDGTTNA
jgi:hypothetical protein